MTDTDTKFQILEMLEKDMIAFLKDKGFYDKPFTSLFKIRIKAEKQQEWLTNLQKTIPQTQVEKGCICYEISQDLEDSNLYAVYEKWANGEALEYHFAQPYTKEFLGCFADIVVDVKSHILKPLSFS